jgi:hypothetical protein
MSEGPTIAAVGLDFARYLPGVFAANFFGPPYVELIGRERLMAAPASQVASVDDGVLVALDDDPAHGTIRNGRARSSGCWNNSAPSTSSRSAIRRRPRAPRTGPASLLGRDGATSGFGMSVTG